MQTTEVTQWQWKSVMKNSPWSAKDFVQSNRNNPAVYISWNDCKEFIRRLNQKEGITKYRLPTEAEWEYAARGGSNSKYCFGDNERQLGSYAWYEKNAWDIGEKYAHGVALKKANQFGLYDMHGNVREWCEDFDGNNSSENVIDPTGPSTGYTRVRRGGSWSYTAAGCRSASRYGNKTDYNSNSLGFRLSRTP